MSSKFYKEHILDHYKKPRNFGSIQSTHHAEAKNVSCGDELEVFLNVEEGIIQKVSFKGQGCAISIATMSMLSEKLVGAEVDTLLKGGGDLLRDMALELVGLNRKSGRYKCAVIGAEAVIKSLQSPREIKD